MDLKSLDFLIVEKDRLAIKVLENILIDLSAESIRVSSSLRLTDLSCFDILIVSESLIGEIPAKEISIKNDTDGMLIFPCNQKLGNFVPRRIHKPINYEDIQNGILGVLSEGVTPYHK